MYAKYVSNTTSVQAQVISDLAALSSGASIASLSASCDKVNTTLVSTIAPGWTLADSAAPGSGCVVTAPDADALSLKAVRLYAFSTTLIAVMGSENWNATTDTGLNPTGASPNQLIYSATAINTYHLFATPRMLTVIHSNGTMMGALEFMRECEYLKGSAYPCFAVASTFSLQGTNSQSYAPRLKNLTATGDLTGTNAQVIAATLSTKYVGFSTPGKSPASINDAANVSYYELRPMWAVAVVNSHSAILGQFYEILELSSVAGANFDTFSLGADTYMIVNMSPSAFAFKMA